MAFWKKSDDPWDIDPAKKRREEPVSLFEAEPEEPEEKEGVLSGLFKKKEPEAAPEAIPCPYCGAMMRAGYLSAERGMLRWTPEKPGLFAGSLFASEMIYLSDEGEWQFYKTCHICEACRKLVADVPEIEGSAPNYTWENGAVKPAEESKENGENEE